MKDSTGASRLVTGYHDEKTGTAKMTSRERVLATLNHQEPDRVPVDIGGGGSTTLVVEAYAKLKKLLGIQSDRTEILNETFRAARLDEQTLRRLGTDVRQLRTRSASRWTPPPSPAGASVDIWGVSWKKAFYGEGCFYWELTGRPPLAEARISDLDRFPWPDPEDPGLTEGLAEEAKQLYDETPYAVAADPVYKSFWEMAVRLRGFEQILMDVALDPQFVSALLNKLLEIHLVATRRYLEAAGPYIQIVRVGDDLATQNGLLLSLDSYRRLVKPVQRRYFDLIHSQAQAKIYYHSCGNVTDLIDDLAEIGVDLLNPVQVSAMGDTTGLKATFGHKMAFCGAIDTQRVLPFGTVQEVEAEVQKRIRDLGPGGGFILAAVHNIQPDVPAENILAMADAARKFGEYPLKG
jgi:uroporphyrinogen decarboxylase